MDHFEVRQYLPLVRHLTVSHTPLTVDTRNACGKLPADLTAGKVVKA